MTETSGKTPVHLWIVGILTLLWNAMGVFDYSATQMKLDFYMSQFTPEQLEYFFGFPAWVDGAWATAVWTGLLGSVCLLLRKAWAVPLFGIAILGLAITSIYNFVLSDGLAVMGEGAGLFTVVIWVIAVALFIYARAMTKRRVLT